MANTPMSSSRERWISTDPLMEFGTTTSSPAWTILVFAQATCFHLLGKLGNLQVACVTMWTEQGTDVRVLQHMD